MRRQDIEGVGDDCLRRFEVASFQKKVGQPGGIDLAGGSLQILSSPILEGARIVVPRHQADAPGVGQVPRLAAPRRRAVVDEKAGGGDDLAPDLLLLPGGEERFQLAAAGVVRLLVEPAAKGAERQDVGRLPHREVPPDLESIELAQQRLGQAPVGRDHGSTRGQAREQFGLGEHPDRQFS